MACENPKNLPDFKWIGTVKTIDFDIDSLEKKILASAQHKTSSLKYIKAALQCMDLTTLNETDTLTTIQNLCNKITNPSNELKHFNVRPAAVCVYPVRVRDAVTCLEDFNLHNPAVKIASVAAGFPKGQLPLESKLKEIEYAIAEGANEIDIVINRTFALTGQWNELFNEVKEMKQKCGEKIHMKTILATGELETLQNVYIASKLAILAGSDFIKTSTGKEAVNATIPVGIVMCRAIKEHYEQTGKKVGFKPAGGIKTVEDATRFLVLVEEMLGAEWFSPNLFRIGASSLLADVESALKTHMSLE